MALRPVLHFPDPKLREKAQPVVQFDDELRTLVEDMFDTMYEDNGAGLAATQLGISQHLFVVDVSRNRSKKQVFINLEILERVGTQVNEEGCLSFPGVFAKVKRAQQVRVKYQDLEGNKHELTAEGYLAQAIQHELDHLVGRLFVDHLSTLRRQLLLKKLKKRQRQAL